MAKSNVKYVCAECGYETVKWLGKCPGCEAWNSLQEEIVVKQSVHQKKSQMLASMNEPVSIADETVDVEARWQTGMLEFDRVLGGGIVPGAVMLLGGDPGIGKSTLLTQTANWMSEHIGTCLYLSGEESVKQVKLRAQRLGTLSTKFLVAAETELNSTIALIERIKPKLVIVDSIQTLYDNDSDSAPGSVSQIRSCASSLQRTAKTTGIPIFLIGHVTKEGALAGPRLLEHLVDTVLYFEGDNQSALRVLRAVKNRFGATDEIGVFEMRERGLIPIENASAVLLSERAVNTPGSAVVAALEGSRSLLAEVQALGAPSYLNNPRRVISGLDYNRLSLVMAVMEKRLGFRLASHDVFINIAGGIKILEPAADLAALVSLASSMKDLPVNTDTIVFGEVGLGGEVRSVGQVDRRLKEAIRLGFKRAVVPFKNRDASQRTGEIEVIGVRNARQAIDLCLDVPAEFEKVVVQSSSSPIFDES